MKIAAAYALADLAREKHIPDEVKKAYNGQDFKFGFDYILPKPLDPRILEVETIAVAKAAMESGVAARPIKDFAKYKKELYARVENAHKRAKAVYPFYR